MPGHDHTLTSGRFGTKQAATTDVSIDANKMTGKPNGAANTVQQDVSGNYTSSNIVV